MFSVAMKKTAKFYRGDKNANEINLFQEIYFKQ